MGLDDLLQRNRTWAAYMVAQDPEYFTRHTGGQKPRILWIGCADSRVPGEQVLSSRPGWLPPRLRVLKGWKVTVSPSFERWSWPRRTASERRTPRYSMIAIASRGFEPISQ